MNPQVKIISERVLSDNHYILKEVDFEYKDDDITAQKITREVFDRGNGAAIVLYNQQSNSVILIRQFRLPTYLNGNSSGVLIEACAGVLDEINPEDCIIREAKEETGYHLDQVQKIMEIYPSPGAVTEILHLFIAKYSAEMKLSKGGGLEQENENIQVFEIKFPKAIEMIKSGEIKDAKTILILQYLQLNNILKL